jgi:unsaturated chondroitin disaccharide hydrolase
MMRNDPHDLMRRALATCSAKARRTVPQILETRRTGAFAADGDYFRRDEGFFDIGNWTTSFFTGMALLDIELSGDRDLLAQVQALAGLYEEKVTTHRADTMHDLGFLYTLYSVGLYRQTGDTSHRATALRAADELARRFVPQGRYIRAWGRLDDDGEYSGLAIIDCLMNLPLLFWAAQETGERRYHDIAVAHADTTLRHFVRPDDTVCHAYRFDAVSGAPLHEDNFCAHGVGTQWARGTTWAIYGFALAHRHTGARQYLDASLRLARRFIAQLDALDPVPVWDFRLSPGMPPLRDSSAAAIAVCALQELRASVPDDELLARASHALLTTLCTRYVDHDPACLGVLREGEVGHGRLPGSPLYKARSAYTSWGDYYLMEALARELHGLKSTW